MAFCNPGYLERPHHTTPQNTFQCTSFFPPLAVPLFEDTSTIPKTPRATIHNLRQSQPLHSPTQSHSSHSYNSATEEIQDSPPEGIVRILGPEEVVFHPQVQAIDRE